MPNGLFGQIYNHRAILVALLGQQITESKPLEKNTPHSGYVCGFGFYL